MKTKKKIQHEIDTVLDSVNHIEEVKVSPFFKDKTLHHLFSKKEDEQKLWSWFSPQLQLVTLMVVVALNVLIFTQLDSETSNDDIEEFAQTYSLSSSEYQSVFN